MVVPFRRRRSTDITPTDITPTDVVDRTAAKAARPGRVLHLCRFPEKCCTTCDRHRDRCAHPIGRTTW